MKTTKRESASLWNIVVNETIDAMNTGDNQKRFDKAIAKFRKRLDAIVDKHAAMRQPKGVRP